MSLLGITASVHVLRYNSKGNDLVPLLSVKHRGAKKKHKIFPENRPKLGEGYKLRIRKWNNLAVCCLLCETTQVSSQ